MMDAERSGHVYCGHLDAQALPGLLSSWFADGGCAIVRRVDDAQFVPFRTGEAAQLVADWAEGQVFSEAAELRWRRQGEDYAVLLLTETSQAPEGFQRLAGSHFTVVRPSDHANHGFLLWGTRRTAPATWWEARIPRPLEYPIQQRDREGADTSDQHRDCEGAVPLPHIPPPRLAYRLYLEGAAVRWVRLVGLEEETRDASY